MGRVDNHQVDNYHVAQGPIQMNYRMWEEKPKYLNKAHGVLGRQFSIGISLTVLLKVAFML